MKKTNSKGFTLIELLVVIAIIGILTAIVTANFTKAKASSRDAKRISDLAQIQLNFELFFDRCNQYPASLDLNYKCPTDNRIVVSNYMSVIPTAPTPGSAYEYAVNSSKTDYVLKATLETNNQALVDAPTNVSSSIINPPTCIHTVAPYSYCVVPK